MLKKLCIGVLLVAGTFELATAASFSCAQPVTKTEKLICSDEVLSALDEKMAEAYLAAHLNSPEQVALSHEQKDWRVMRDACVTTACMIDLYARRTAALSAIADSQKSRARQTAPCYIEQKVFPNGKRIGHEPVCRAMLKNLNQLCHRPPMACGLEVAPAFKQTIRLPQWAVIKPDPNLAEEIMRGPWRDNAEIDRRLWLKTGAPLAEAVKEGRLFLARTEFDLYNEGQMRQVYRVDLGDCRQRNPQMDDPLYWTRPITPAPVDVLLAPEEYAKTAGIYAFQPWTFSEVFTFDQRSYSYNIYGPDQKPNRVDIDRASRLLRFGKKYMQNETICTFHYFGTK